MQQHTDIWLITGLNSDIWDMAGLPGASSLGPCLSGEEIRQKSFVHKKQKLTQTNINETDSTGKSPRQSLGWLW